METLEWVDVKADRVGPPRFHSEKGYGDGDGSHADGRGQGEAVMAVWDNSIDESTPYERTHHVELMCGSGWGNGFTRGFKYSLNGELHNERIMEFWYRADGYGAGACAGHGCEKCNGKSTM